MGKGTTITVRLPYLPGKIAPPPEPSYEDKYRLPPKYRSLPADSDGLETPSANAAIADVGLTSRFGALEVGAQAGVTYSSVPSYEPDLGPSPSGIVATAGPTAALRW